MINYNELRLELKARPSYGAGLYVIDLLVLVLGFIYKVIDKVIGGIMILLFWGIMLALLYGMFFSVFAGFAWLWSTLMLGHMKAGAIGLAAFFSGIATLVCAISMWRNKPPKNELST